MRRKFGIALSIVLLVVTAGAVAVFAYDRAREELIAEGVTVAGVDVGGLRAGEARGALRRALAARLARPLGVRGGGRRFVLSGRRARRRADVRAMVGEALARSRQGNIVSRTLRDLSGDELRAELPARVTYSRAAVSRFARALKRAVDRQPLDARVEPSGGGLRTVPARSGRSVRLAQLRRRIERALGDPAAARSLTAPLEVRPPAVTRAELADRYPYFITVDRARFRLHFYERLRRVKSYVIAVGQIGFETPEGLYHIQNKAVNPAWSVPNSPWAGTLAGQVIPPGPDNPIKSRWMGIYDGAGIHGTAETYSLGTAASHGCIRMSIPEVEELYDQVPVRTPVYIG
jgi:lipoprotein-anchoring transpeptidase ErfK/SrfK